MKICGGDLPHTYAGLSKTDGSSIRLPLNSYSNGQFEAVSQDNILYSLSRDRLLVIQGDEILVNQEVISWN